MQALDIFGITVKRHYAPGRAHQSRRTQCERSKVRAHVVHNIAGADHRTNGALHARFVLAAPETSFLRDTQAHPETLRKTGLDLYPGRSAPQGVALGEILGVVESDLRFWPATEHRHKDTLLESKISAIDEEVEEVQGDRDASKIGHALFECTAAIEGKAKATREAARNSAGAFGLWEGMTRKVEPGMRCEAQRYRKGTGVV